MTYFNKEHYPDPTAEKAVQKVKHELKARGFRPLAYISVPINNDKEANMAAARKLCQFAVNRGYVPLAPQLLFPQFMNYKNPMEYALAAYMSRILLGKCHEVWMLEGRLTEETAMEILAAQNGGKIIRKFTEDMEEVKCTK